MRNTLLTTTALVLTAGIASADGHATVTWSGSATAGFAREGTVAKVAAGAQSASGKVAQAAAIADTNDSAGVAASTSVVAINSITTALLFQEQAIDDADAKAETLGAVAATHTGSTAAAIATDLAAIRLEFKNDRAEQVALQIALATTSAAYITAKNMIAGYDAASAILDNAFGTVAVAETKTGKFKTYSEVNATVTGTVALDNGMSLSAAMSVDAGTGYDFANDDGFDAAKTNGVGLDNVTLDAGSLGKIKLDDSAVAHLVDADDDKTADILYTNTIGSVSVSVAMDISEDKDVTAKKAAAATTKWVVGVNSATASLDKSGYLTQDAAAVAAVAEDVQWSAKIAMPIGAGSVYVAMDEEGGNAFGVSTTFAGVGISFDSKLEALEERLAIDRNNTIGLTYVMGAANFGATWNSVEDKDQWGISAGYTADGMTIAASTDEGSDWSINGSVDLATGAKVVAGTNYTEDAYLGLSFAF